MQRTLVKCSVAVAAACLLAGGAFAGPITYVSGTSDTVYGVTGYGAPIPGVATYILNNLTGFNDILSSPGGPFQTADPVVANNIADLGGGLIADPNFFYWIGGSNVNGTFGAGATVDSGPAVTFALSDSTAGCCEASYMITSTDAFYQTGVNGYVGSLGAVLAIGGSLPTVSDSVVASLVVDYNIDNTGWNALPAMILAVNGTCVDVAAGTFAAISNPGCDGPFSALAVDNVPGFNIGANQQIEVESTITLYADPASIDTIAPDLSLIPGVQLPGFNLEDAATPEPFSCGLVGFGLLGVGFCLRRRRSR